MITRADFMGGIVTALTPIVPLGPSLSTIRATIGVAGPFTGNDQMLGLQLENGARQAIDEANQFHGSFDGLMTLRTFDDQNLLLQATVTAQFAVDDPSVLCVIGHLSGRATEAALRTYSNAKLPVIVPASSYEPLTSYGYGGVLRIPTKDSTEGRLGASFALEKFRPKSITVLFRQADYGPDVAQGFKSQAESSKVPCQSVSLSREKPAFEEAARQAMNSAPDLIYLAGSANDMGAIVPALRAAEYKGAFMASQGFFSSASIDTHGAELEGAIVSSSIPPFQSAPANQRFIEDFRQNYGEFTPLSALGYAAAQIAIAAIRRAGSSNRLAVWQSIQNPASYDTVLGSFSFLSTGDQVEPNLYFYEIKNRAWKYARAAHSSNFFPS